MATERDPDSGKVQGLGRGAEPEVGRVQDPEKVREEAQVRVPALDSVMEPAPERDQETELAQEREQDSGLEEEGAGEPVRGRDLEEDWETAPQSNHQRRGSSQDHTHSTQSYWPMSCNPNHR